jgi:hypothetical protein
VDIVHGKDKGGRCERKEATASVGQYLCGGVHRTAYIQRVGIGYTMGTGAGERTFVVGFLEVSHLDGWMKGVLRWKYHNAREGK